MKRSVAQVSEGTAEVVRLREHDGWRSGKPVEDPEKMKRWGYVTAKPSEFLVHVRGGRVVGRSSGQGATCFKWPNDAVAIVPTSLQRLQFRADQVTSEKIGVEVVGLAVYRIADPLLAYRVLNFSYPERAQEKLEETLTSMFVGASRRLIANLSLEDCLQKRKSALAEELLREIAPVVGGRGRPDDTTDRGWGVVIDTIEIQEVRILSEKVFAAMQAPYRALLEKQAREAKALADMDIARREAECSREIAEAKSIAERDIATRRAQLGQEVAEAKIRSEAAINERKAAAERKEAEDKTKAEIQRMELSAAKAKAMLEASDLEAEAIVKSAELDRAAAGFKAELRRAEAELVSIEGRAAAEIERLRAEVAARQAEADARIEVARNLPALAAAVGGRIGEVRIAQYGGDGNPFGAVVQAIDAVLDLAKRGS